jgi:hypothetical protein
VAAKNPVAGRRVAEFQARLGVSNRELARRVFEVWREAEAKLPIKDADGLAVKVNQLRDGVLTWWLKHSGAVHALADVLRCHVSDLEIRKDEPGAHLFRFEDVPDLAIDLRSDRIPVLGQPNWFTDAWFRQPGLFWIEAPPGAGRSLAARWLAARGVASVLPVTRLADAVERLVEGPLVIDVEEADPDGDRLALRRLGTRTQLLVLAPFSPPDDESDSREEGDSRQGSGSREMWGRSQGAESPPRRSGFVWYRWHPDPSWQSIFLRWIAERQRLGDAWVQQRLAWIDKLDPSGSLFTTPGELLPLLGFAWSESPRRFRAASFVEDWLASSIARNADDRSPCSLWLQTNGRALVRALIEARFADASVPWTGGLSRARWAAFVPPRLAARRSGDAVRRELEALCEVSPRRRAKKIEETVRRLDEPAPEEAIQYLVSVRLLRAVGVDRLDLHPRWMAAWHALGHVGTAVVKEPPSAWGRWCIDDARRPFIDIALDALDAARFKGVARRALDEWSDATLGCVGAVEAIFYAVARRLKDGPPLDGANLARLLQLQLQILQRRGGWAPEPLTRPGIATHWSGSPEWIWCCWAWSLHVARPPAIIPDDYAWLFPGWTRPRISAAPDWLKSMHPRNDEAQAHQPVWDGLHRMARSIVDRCDDTELPARIPEILFPEVVRASLRKGWKIISRHHSRGKRAASRVAVAVASLPEADQIDIARGLWQGLLAEKDHYPLRNLDPAMFAFIAQHLTEDDVRQAVRERKLEFDLLDPRKESEDRCLPLLLWEAALHELVVVGPPGTYGVHNLETWPSWTGAIVEALIGRDANEPVSIGIGHLWAVDPDRALRRAADAYPDGANAKSWILEGWKRRREDILRLIVQSPHRPLPGWGRQWLAEHFRDIPGHGADQIYELIVGST